jgi:VIT1/CCC1 family predicted Fe2+/Mn2+ transporter
LFGDVVVVGSEDVLEKENGERRLESRFAGEYIEDLDVSFSFSFFSSAAGFFIGVMMPLALEIFSDAVAGTDPDANEAVSLSGVSMLILIYQISRSNASKRNHIN